MKTVIEMAREVLLLDERDNPNDDGIAQFIGTLTDFAELVRADERNDTLDEVAKKIEAMPFGDTAASFAVWIREQKS